MKVNNYDNEVVRLPEFIELLQLKSIKVFLCLYTYPSTQTVLVLKAIPQERIGRCMFTTLKET